MRIYCDTDAGAKDTGVAMGEALKRRLEMGFTFLKMDLGIGQLGREEGTLSAPLGSLDQFGGAWRRPDPDATPEERRWARNRAYDLYNVAHPFTGIHITEKGLDRLEQYVAEVRSIIGYEVPLAVDHFGPIALESGIRLARALDKYRLAWGLLAWVAAFAVTGAMY